MTSSILPDRAPIQEAQVDVGPFRTRYLHGGPESGDVVLCLHDGAFGATAEVTWRSVMERLATRYRLIAPDMLGFGGTDKVAFFDRPPYVYRAAHIATLLRQLEVREPVHVIGNSFGGTVALRATLLDGVWSARSVTSVAGSGGPWRTDFAVKVLGTWDGTREGLATIMREIVEPDWPGFDEWVDQRFTWATRNGHFRALRSLGFPLPDRLQRPAQEDPWPRQLQRVETPLLLVHGSRDRMLESGWAEAVAAAAPNGRALVMDAKHAPNVDHADEFVAELEAFYAEVG